MAQNAVIDLNTDFNNIIGIVFNNWTGLKLVVDYGNGGTPIQTKLKIENLITNIRHLLDCNADSYTVSDELEAVLDEQFCTLIEDGSNDEVASELIQLYNFWNGSNIDSINTKLRTFKSTESILKSLNRISVRPLNRTACESDAVEEDNPMEQSNNDDEMSGEDDEWTVVGKKKR